MTDLTFSYLHMTECDLDVLDTIGTSDFLAGDLADSEIDVPLHLKPPNPEESDILPSHVHPSYPYGNPFSIQHPASFPRRPLDPSSRALFEDMTYGGGGVNGSLRWKDLGLERLFPIDRRRQEAERATQARKMASGAASHPNHPPPPAPPAQEQILEEEDEDEDDEDDGEDEDENDENDDADGTMGEDDDGAGETSYDEAED